MCYNDGDEVMILKKKILLLAMILAVCLGIAGCSSDKPSADPLVAKWVAKYNDEMCIRDRPNMLAASLSKKKKTRQLFWESLCPEDLILLSRADAEGKLDAPYDARYWDFLQERLKDYYACLERPMVTGKDLIQAGCKPGPALGRRIARARQLHFSGLEKNRALHQVLKEIPPEET